MVMRPKTRKGLIVDSEIEADIIRRYEGGESIRDIANVIHVHTRSIKLCLVASRHEIRKGKSAHKNPDILRTEDKRDDNNTSKLPSNVQLFQQIDDLYAKFARNSNGLTEAEKSMLQLRIKRELSAPISYVAVGICLLRLGHLQEGKDGHALGVEEADSSW